MSGSGYLWIKAFHIIFMVCWFAGIFYLPRLFVNHAMETDRAACERLQLMEYKLYRFMTPFAWLTAFFGFWMLAQLGSDVLLGALWLQIKLALVGCLILYHLWCGRIVRQFAAQQNTRSHVFYRWFNEAPVLILFVAIILVVVKPL